MSPHPPRHKVFAAALLVILVSLSGCMSQADGIDEKESGTGPAVDGGPDPGDSVSEPIDEGGAEGDDSATDGGNNTTADPGDNATTPPSDNTTVVTEPTWPPLADAKVRPGVQIKTSVDGGTAQCTTNFVFRNVLNDTYYIGTAAHCVDGATGDDPVTVLGKDGKAAFKSRVAYSSWDAIGFEPQPTTGGSTSHRHDFALIEIPAEHLGLVHPATLHFGGPTRMGDRAAVSPLDGVMVYGNSGLRLGLVEESNWQEGVAYGTFKEETDEGDAHMILANVVSPPVFGDSGSGLMAKDGAALGSLSGPNLYFPWGYALEYSSVPDAVAYMNADGWRLQLMTWDVITPGLLP